MPGGFKLLRAAFKLLRTNWKLFGGIAVIYGVLNLVLVPTLTGADLNSIKSTLDQTVTGQAPSPLASSLSLFGYILGAAGGTNTQVAGVYRFLLVLIASLATIWALRELYAGRPVRIRDGFYRGMYPLVTSLLVLSVAVLQLLPMAAGSYLFSLVYSNPNATSVELLAWGVAAFMLLIVSLYWVCASLIALYIVCLPNVTPLAALRSARELVKFRRWTIIRRLIFLPVVLLLVALIVMLPILLSATALAGWVFVLLMTLALPAVHAYMYGLYRGLLDETE